MLTPRFAAVLPLCAALSACAATGPSAPTTVALPDGRTGHVIYTSVQDTRAQSPAELATTSTLLQGNGRGGLAMRATATCPGGYDIVQRSAPNSRFVMTLANGVPLYKIEQTFTIACS